jgi:hypothetical protein
MESNYNHKNIGIFIGILVVIAVIGTTTFEEMQTPARPAKVADTFTGATTQTPADTANTPPTTPVTPVTTPTQTATTPAITQKQYVPVYKNGTYSATGSYMSPGGEEQVGVTLTLANDIITAVSVTPGAYDRTSARYQDRFISGYKTYVIGKNIAKVNLGIISGSSLTPEGFNDALAQIKTQAKA